MFTKVLIANRGEIAVRILRTCREMGITTVAIFTDEDFGSLHVRMADESVRLSGDEGYLDQEQIIEIARQRGAEAIHPGYGFLAQSAPFIEACEAAGLVFVGPPAGVVATLNDKINAQERAREAGFKTPLHSPRPYGEGEFDAIKTEADRLGYPLIIKSYGGGRGAGTRLVRNPEKLESTVQQSQKLAQAVFGSPDIYLEQAILPSHYVEVQLLADHHGNIVHLGERDGSIQRNNQKIVEESPAPYLSDSQREQLWQQAIAIARLFEVQNACSVEFLVGLDGEFYFTDVKTRIQVEHPVSEMVSHIDIVREQLRIAAGEPLGYSQDEIRLDGWAIQCRINAEDPWNRFLPSPGTIRVFRAPGGPHVRIDTYAHSGCDIPARYDPIFAKMTVWGADRGECIMRSRRALEEFFVSGIQTNLPLHQLIMSAADFLRGDYTTEFSRRPLLKTIASDLDRRNLAVAAAIAYTTRYQRTQVSQPERVRSGWHRDSRRLPQ
jgi:acetyl/propionyl-CoA carboxylase alpha subunit